MLNDKNYQICFEGQELMNIFVEIDFILISLAGMGRNFELYEKREFYEKDTTKFIDECNVTERLATIRAIIAKKFDNTFGVDDMDDLERATQNTNYWKGNF